MFINESHPKWISAVPFVSFTLATLPIELAIHKFQPLFDSTLERRVKLTIIAKRKKASQQFPLSPEFNNQKKLRSNIFIQI